MMDESTYDILINEYGMTPEEIESLMELGVLSGEGDILERQMTQAEALHARPDARGRQVGRVYKAANPLEHVAVGLDRVRGGRDIAQIPGQQRDVAQEQMQKRIEFLMAGRRNPGVTVNPSAAIYPRARPGRPY